MRYPGAPFALLCRIAGIDVLLCVTGVVAAGPAAGADLTVGAAAAAAPAPGPATGAAIDAQVNGSVSDGTVVSFAGSVARVVAPPNVQEVLSGNQTRIDGDYGPSFGTLEVVSADATTFSATVDLSGARTLGKISGVRIQTAAGVLAIDSLDSSAVCAFGKPPTATAAVSGSVTLGGVVQALDPSGVTSLTPALNTPGGPTGTLTITVSTPKPFITATDATATAMTVTVAENTVYTKPAVTLTQIETINLATSSCATPLTPTLDLVEPGKGGPGDPLTLTGTGFVPGATSVEFGGQPVPSNNVKVLTGTTLVLNVPGGLPPGPLAVSVSTPAGTSKAQPFEVIAPTTTSGRITEAETGAPLRNACVMFAPQSDLNQRNFTGVNGDGTWSFTPANAGPFVIAFYLGANGCGGPILPTPIATWYQNQPVTGTDPATIVPPKALTLVKAGSANVDTCLARTLPAVGKCAIADGTLSGRVTSLKAGVIGPEPSCIFILGERADQDTDSLVGFAITAADGTWTATGLPINTRVVVGAVPVFRQSGGPCESDNGPPPVSAPGQPQPEFWTNTWIDLSNPELDGDSFRYAVSHGAQVISGSRTGVDLCLTTDPGTVVPRPSCQPVVPTTSRSTTPVSTPSTVSSATATVTTTVRSTVTVSTSSAVAPASTGTGPAITVPAGPILAATGTSAFVLIPVGSVLVALGACLLAMARRRRPAHR